MKLGSSTQFLALSAIVLVAFIVSGSSQKGGDASSATASQESGHDRTEGGHNHAEDGHNLHGYWCVEHGVPEGICAQCNTKLAAEFQQKRDGCEEHKRPDSQCFNCHPELQEKFIARYEAKFGEKPPKSEVE